VVVNDPADTRNEAFIRSQLSKEAALFCEGDYSDPTMIHGTGMPGVRGLAAGAVRAAVDFVEVRGGAQITESSAAPARQILAVDGAHFTVPQESRCRVDSTQPTCAIQDLCASTISRIDDLESAFETFFKPRQSDHARLTTPRAASRRSTLSGYWIPRGVS
jgi:hypothetical protein